ncbi:hypothetical protein H2200_012906 [Cladophialophora chaetospira]|uniref:G-protein coupled receptors family 2 profile 2 domain-containing protein n=1 Tax=Cladophialophora chaetospira TaxID=386627 RepID=A0AA38WX37_9EURO|nr:hypothetical protein H2200_012906 [Cladophialophora chaetospira]
MTDPLLIMIMSFNVFLTVRTKRNATELKRIDFVAVALAFILPFTQAFTYLLWRPNGKTVYGPATLWCWIAKESALLRLVAFFVPIWCFVSVAILFLALSGKQILRVWQNVKAAKGESDLHREEPAIGPDGFPLPQERRFSSFARAFMAPTRRESVVTKPKDNLSGQIPSPQLNGHDSLSPLAIIRSHDSEPRRTGSYPQESLYHSPSSSAPFGTWNPATPPGTLDRSASDQSMLQNHEQSLSRRSSSRFDRIHWKYAKFALLCTLVLFVTWIPISVNRVYNLAAPEKAIFGLYASSAACVPLHGFGNFCIYLSISWTECKEFVTCSGPRRRPSLAGQLKERRMTWFKNRMRKWLEARREVRSLHSDVDLRRGSRSGEG